MSRGRKSKINDLELLKFISDQENHTNMGISVVFDCTPQTARNHIKTLRKDGHTIIPTHKGQRYIKQIKTTKDLDDVMAVINWAARANTGMRTIANTAKALLADVPEDVKEKARKAG